MNQPIMTLPELLDRLDTLCIALEPNGENIRYRAPIGTMTPALRNAIRTHKAELITMLISKKNYATICAWYRLPVTTTADELDAHIRRQAYAQAIIDMQTALSDLAKQSKHNG